MTKDTQRLDYRSEKFYLKNVKFLAHVIIKLLNFNDKSSKSSIRIKIFGFT